jgi:HNH endonuclease
MPVTEAMKKKVAAKNYYKCANMPGKNLRGLEDFLCPLWQIGGENRGCFGITYEIDHIVEKALGGSDDEQNLQAICSICHAYKTRCFLMNKNLVKNTVYENIIICDKLHDIYIKQNNKLISLHAFNKSNDNFNDSDILNEIHDHLITNKLVDRIISNNSFIDTMLNYCNPKPENIVNGDKWYTHCVKGMILFILKLHGTEIKIPELVDLFFNIIEKCIVPDINNFFSCTCEDIIKHIYKHMDAEKIIIINKKKMKGYIHFNDGWYKINKSEPLHGWINKYCNLACMYEEFFGDIMNDMHIKQLIEEHKLGSIIKYRKLSNLMQITDNNNYLMQVTIQILLTTCYNSSFKIDPLETYEFILYCNNKYILMNAKDKTHVDISDQPKMLNECLEYVPKLIIEDFDSTFITELMEKWLSDSKKFIDIFRSIFFGLGKIFRINMMRNEKYTVRQLINEICRKLIVSRTIHGKNNVFNDSKKNNRHLVIFENEPDKAIFEKYKRLKYTIIINDKEKDVFENPDMLSEYQEFRDQQHADSFLETLYVHEIIMYIFENI